MSGVVRKKVSPASARSHTRKPNRNSSSFLASEKMKLTVVLLTLGILVAWAYQARIRPPPPQICGSPVGPPITAPRIKLRDGRHLAYKEHGVPKLTSNFNIIFIHGFGSCRHDAIPLSPQLVEELRVYLVSFDRPGYGESDPDPHRTPKSLALDIQDLADHLNLGSKFYLIGFSMGAQVVWGCLNYIPHRLAGATLVSPVINYWWPRFPANVSREAYNQQPLQDQWALRIAHYTPWLTYWWNTQKWFPAASAVSHNPAIFSRQDMELMPKLAMRQHMAQVRQQGDYESLHRDMIVGFGSWEFDPMDLKNPFANNNEGSVHLWHGDDDQLVFVTPQRYIAGRLPWIHYHEISGAGHLLHLVDGMSETIVKSLLLGG